MTRPFLLSAYLAASALAQPLARMVIRHRRLRGKEDPVRSVERLGRPGLPRPDGRLVWFHGASVGEAMSLLPLVAAMRDAAPDTTCLMTTGTVSSARRLQDLMPAGTLHQFVPVDTKAAVHGFLEHWRPDLAIWAESEFWPRLMVETAGRGTAMMLVNARISQDTAERWGLARPVMRHLMRLFDRIVTQDEETEARMRALGADPARLRVGGNLKALAPVPGFDPVALSGLYQDLAERRVWLAASTHPGEEEIVLDAHRVLPGDCLLILAPRHPERARAIIELLHERNLPFARQSRAETVAPGHRVLLADTMGQMGLWLRLAPITFVGGSLVEKGGHTPFEPAALGSAILHGPHTENFAPAYRALARAEGARLVRTDRDLAREIAVLLNDPTAMDGMVHHAQVLTSLAPDPHALAREALSLVKRPR